MEAWVSFDKNIGLIYFSSVNLTNLGFFFSLNFVKILI
jgi:hypothetical protein